MIVSPLLVGVATAAAYLAIRHVFGGLLGTAGDPHGLAVTGVRRGDTQV
jgi:hypothetical protein